MKRQKFSPKVRPFHTKACCDGMPALCLLCWPCALLFFCVHGDRTIRENDWDCFPTRVASLGVKGLNKRRKAEAGAISLYVKAAKMGMFLFLCRIQNSKEPETFLSVSLPCRLLLQRHPDDNILFIVRFLRTQFTVTAMLILVYAPKVCTILFSQHQRQGNASFLWLGLGTKIPPDRRMQKLQVLREGFLRVSSLMDNSVWQRFLQNVQFYHLFFFFWNFCCSQFLLRQSHRKPYCAQGVEYAVLLRDCASQFFINFTSILIGNTSCKTALSDVGMVRYCGLFSAMKSSGKTDVLCNKSAGHCRKGSCRGCRILLPPRSGDSCCSWNSKAKKKCLCSILSLTATI